MNDQIPASAPRNPDPGNPGSGNPGPENLHHGEPERRLAHGGAAGAEAAEAEIRTRRPFNFIWAIPIVAALIAGYLGYNSLTERGPTVTITFKSADGLTAGQTTVKHKAVDLGTVRSINLSEDMTHVDVRVEMRREAARVLTDQARFWVVRPRFDAANISGLDTLISGAYIELDPGTPNGHAKRDFVGLEDPPAVRSDEPGRTFVIHADRIGQLASGSPVFYRDIDVGEVLGYDLGQAARDVTIHVFIRSPFDQYVYENSHFWNVSGASVELGSEGVQLHIASLQAVISGGVAFDTPKDVKPTTVSKTDATFRLYSNEAAANSAGFRERIPFITYVDGSVRGLAVGAPVELYGIQIGNVTGVQLLFDPNGAGARVEVRMEVEPERILQPDQPLKNAPLEVARNLVAHGLRVQLQTSNILTGQLLAAMVFVPEAPAAEVSMEGDAIVLPSTPGGLDSITSGVSQLVAKLTRLPLDDIAKNLNDTLRGASEATNGPELKQVLASLSTTMGEVQEFVHATSAGITPTLRRLPAIAASLQAGVDRANRLIGSVDSGYGGNSDVQRNVDRVLAQVSDTARSVRLLADFLAQHPEALLRGRTGAAGAP